MWISHLFQLAGILDFIFPKQKSILNIYKIMLCCYQLSGVETLCEGVNASNKNLLPSWTAITFKNTAADWKPSTHALETVSCSKCFCALTLVILGTAQNLWIAPIRAPLLRDKPELRGCLVYNLACAKGSPFPYAGELSQWQTHVQVAWLLVASNTPRWHKTASFGKMSIHLLDGLMSAAKRWLRCKGPVASSGTWILCT